MPTKKIRKKRKKTAVKEKKQIETDIEEAVKKIPEFLFSKIETSLPPSAPPVKNQPINYQLYRTRHLLLWLGVAALAAAVFSMWIWNINNFWQDARKKTSVENGLWQEAKSGISALNKPLSNESQTALEQNQTKEAIKQRLKTELAKDKIKNALGQTMAGYLTMTTTSKK